MFFLFLENPCRNSTFTVYTIVYRTHSSHLAITLNIDGEDKQESGTRVWMGVINVYSYTYIYYIHTYYIDGEDKQESGTRVWMGVIEP
jgi:hypothetical protein